MPDAYRLAHQALGAVMKVTPEVVERIVGLRRLGRGVADIAQLCGLSEPTVKKVLRRVTTKKSATETQETGTENRLRRLKPAPRKLRTPTMRVGLVDAV